MVSVIAILVGIGCALFLSIAVTLIMTVSSNEIGNDMDKVNADRAWGNVRFVDMDNQHKILIPFDEGSYN